MTTYRSAGMLKPPHGTRGHELRVTIEGRQGAPPLIPNEPHVWTCYKCHHSHTNPHHILQNWCPDAHRALTETTP